MSCNNCYSSTNVLSGSEVTGSYVNTPGHFATLGGYNSTMPGTVFVGPPQLSSVEAASTQLALIPAYGGSATFSSLQNGQPNMNMNNGYFRLAGAYPAFPNNCVPFLSNNCGH